jgi:putative ABC transport system permease protein
MLLPRLALNHLRFRKVRTLLTIAAIALSVSLVVAVTTGYRSVLAMAERFQDTYLGSADAQITRRDESRTEVPYSLVTDLKNDPRVKSATGRLETESRLLDPEDPTSMPSTQTATGRVKMRRYAHVIGIHRPDDNRVSQLTLTEGHWFNSATGNVAVIDTNIAERQNLSVGGIITLPGISGDLKLKVTGIVRKPGIMAGIMHTMYVPLETLQKFVAPDAAASVTRIQIDVKPGTDLQKFADDWSTKLKVIDPSLRIRLARESRKQLDDNLESVHLLSMLGGAVSMLAATFIVFSALSMGVAERQRTLAMMRAVGAQRTQVGWLVIIEGMLLAGIGVAVGVPAGWAWIKILAFGFRHRAPIFFASGVHLDSAGVIMASAGSMGAALLASFLPAWSAMRVTPLEAMSPLSNVATRLSKKVALAGLLLVCVDPIVIYGPWSRAFIIYGHFVLGVPSIMFGFFLLAPSFVVAMEAIAGPLIAAMLHTRFELLRQQLSTGIWRAAGTCAALMVGLAILIVMQVQGRTMLGGWTLPDKFPDIFIYRPIGPLSLSDTAKIESVPGIKKGELMPVCVASPELGTNVFQLAVGIQLFPNATMMFGVDPDKAFKMIELDFRAGNAHDAVIELKKGRHVIVTEEFRQLKGLTVGDKLPIKTSRHGTVDYTICGVVWSPGLDVMLGVADPGKQFEQRTAASIFGTIDDLKEDFGVDGVLLYAANLDYFTDKEQLLADIKQKLGTFGLEAGDVRQIKAGIQKFFGNLLLLASSVAFAAMGVSSLGVTNTIMASIRSRRWQFGVLRSIGVTRSQLLRLVVAEAILIGLVGCALGIAAGALLAFDAKHENLVLVGYNPPLVVPYPIIGIGIGIVLVVAMLASAWPAISVARTEPLALLQAGRASA